MVKKRIYEYAKEHNVPSKIVLEKAKELGMNFQSHVSTMENEDIKKLDAVMNKPSQNTAAPKQEKAAQPKKDTNAPARRKTKKPTVAASAEKKGGQRDSEARPKKAQAQPQQNRGPKPAEKNESGDKDNQNRRKGNQTRNKSQGNDNFRRNNRN